MKGSSSETGLGKARSGRNGHRDSGRGRACGSVRRGRQEEPPGLQVPAMRGRGWRERQEDTPQAQETTWARVGARNAQASAFKDEKL